jgi:alkanesulfonate monooxygenase SsuD/methylene tetrahydromethanopterin reductase-like flavin-dependent oxidoreductase (luciferase family)
VTEPVPIVLAALRERMLGLAGEVADGAFTNFLPISGLPTVRAAYEAGARAAGRPAGELVCRFFIIPGDPEDGARLARVMFANYGSVPVYHEFFRWLGWGDRIDPMVEAYRAGERERALELAPEELIREIYLFGSLDSIAARLQEFAAGGVTTLVLAPITAPERLGEVIEALAP